MTRERATTILAAASFLFLIVLFAIAQVRDLKRPPSVDEAEYLHVAARMALGDRLFIDIAEHHPPLFFGMLSLLAPERRGFDEAVAFVARARILAGLCAAIAIAAAALIVHRASGRLHAPLIFVALMLAAAPIWRNGIGDVRPETAALAFWWTGLALVVLARSARLRGLGIGLVFVAAMIVPKWPAESVIAGIVFLARRPAWKGVAVAVITAGAAIGATAMIADLETTYAHVFTLTRAMWGSPAAGTIPVYGCPPLLRPAVIALPLLIVALARIRRRDAFREPRMIELFAVLAAASLLELRLLYYPDVDYRYWVQWSFSAAALLAFVAQSAAAFVPPRVGALVPAGVAALALIAALDHLPERWTGNEAFWRWTRWMEERLGPNDTIWIASRWHPIGAPDAHPYWFGADNMIPAAIRLGLLTEQQLPPCTFPPSLKFLGEPVPAALPAAHACFERLRREGKIVGTPVLGVWMVRR